MSVFHGAIYAIPVPVKHCLPTLIHIAFCPSLHFGFLKENHLAITYMKWRAPRYPSPLMCVLCWCVLLLTRTGRQSYGIVYERVALTRADTNPCQKPVAKSECFECTRSLTTTNPLRRFLWHSENVVPEKVFEQSQFKYINIQIIVQSKYRLIFRKLFTYMQK